MRTIRINQLSEAIRGFVAEAFQAGGLVVEDETGRMRGTFVPYRDPTPDEQRRADASLKRLWQKTSQAMKDAGVTEADIDRDLQEGD